MKCTICGSNNQEHKSFCPASLNLPRKIMKIPIIQENGYWKMEEVSEEGMYRSDHDQSLLYLLSDIANQLRELNIIRKQE